MEITDRFQHQCTTAGWLYLLALNLALVTRKMFEIQGTSEA